MDISKIKTPTVGHLVELLQHTHKVNANLGVDWPLDVRMRCWPGFYEVLTGDPSYDLDHTGLWAGATLDESDNDFEAIAKDMIEQIQMWVDLYNATGITTSGAIIMLLPEEPEDQRCNPPTTFLGPESLN
jgi:hypothetical protein